MKTISEKEKNEARKQNEIMRQREENRARHPWVASFLDDLRAAGFENATVKSINVRST